MLFRSKQMRWNFLLLLDLICIFLAFILGGVARFGTNHEWFLSNLYLTTFAVAELMGIIVFWISVSRQKFITGVGAFQNLIYCVTNGIMLAVFLVFYLFVTQTAGLVSRYQISFFLLFFLPLDFCVRMLYRQFLLKIAGSSNNATNVMLVTVSDDISEIVRNVRSNRGNLTNISCITVLDRDMTGQEIEGIPIAGNRDNFLDTHRMNVYDEVFIHIPYNFEFELKKLIMGFEQMGVTVNLNVEIFNLDAQEKTIGSFGDYSVISYSPQKHSSAEMIIKRLTDIIGSIIGLAITFICLLIFGPLIKATSKGPVFFSQIRVGINGRRFRIYKFRSMYQDAEERKASLMKQNEMHGLMFKIDNDPRITPVGRFLRKTSIDEFPQFLNVLKGDMSLVGTRPPTEEEYEHYKNYHMRRLSIRPGITGLWQVSGRSDIKDFEDVVKLDLKYIDQWSLLLDIKLILMTVGIIFTGKGAK